jgi:hypothetical protein
LFILIYYRDIDKLVFKADDSQDKEYLSLVRLYKQEEEDLKRKYQKKWVVYAKNHRLAISDTEEEATKLGEKEVKEKKCLIFLVRQIGVLPEVAEILANELKCPRWMG